MNGSCPVHGHHPQHTPGEIHLMTSCQCSASHLPVGQWASAGNMVHTQPQPNLPIQASLIQSTITPPVTTTRNRSQCHICPDSFPRWQDRDRHELTHVPYFIHCPLPHCAWRGNRAQLFKKHWQQEDHHPYHVQYGHTPDGAQVETYDPWNVLNQIKSGALSPREGEEEAIVLVQVKAYELQKTNVWTDPWGRRKRHT